LRAQTRHRCFQVPIIGRIVLSAEGKTGTVTSSVTDAKGNRVDSTAIYDKQ
jgi:hypothetical protein